MWDTSWLILVKHFDTVDHVVLTHKLCLLGLPANIFNWIILFVTGRTQYCKVNDVYSAARDINLSIVQGSGIGPCLYTVSQKKNCANCTFFQNFVKFPPILVIFGRKMAKRLTLCEAHSISTSPNSRHHTTVLNADVPNCYTTLKVVICNKLSSNLISTQ